LTVLFAWVGDDRRVAATIGLLPLDYGKVMSFRRTDACTISFQLVCGPAKSGNFVTIELVENSLLLTEHALQVELLPYPRRESFEIRAFLVTRVNRRQAHSVY